MSISPQDILADGIDTTTINGKTLRKGTVAAFLANISIIENTNSAESEKQDAIQMLKQLAPDLHTLGITQHVEFKNPVVRQILLDALA